jgi:hypothetical protein
MSPIIHSDQETVENKDEELDEEMASEVQEEKPIVIKSLTKIIKDLDYPFERHIYET